MGRMFVGPHHLPAMWPHGTGILISAQFICLPFEDRKLEEFLKLGFTIVLSKSLPWRNITAFVTIHGVVATR